MLESKLRSIHNADMYRQFFHPLPLHFSLPVSPLPSSHFSVSFYGQSPTGNTINRYVLVQRPRPLIHFSSPLKFPHYFCLCWLFAQLHRLGIIQSAALLTFSQSRSIFSCLGFLWFLIFVEKRQILLLHTTYCSSRHFWVGKNIIFIWELKA